MKTIYCPACGELCTTVTPVGLAESIMGPQPAGLQAFGLGCNNDHGWALVINVKKDTVEHFDCAGVRPSDLPEMPLGLPIPSRTYSGGRHS